MCADVTLPTAGYAEDYWLLPGEAVTVTSYGVWNDHPFETVHEPNQLAVWVTSWFAAVTDGAQVPFTYNRPPESNE